MSLPRQVGPVEEQLSKLWQKARTRPSEFKNLLKWYKLNRKYDLSFVKYSEIKIQIPKGKVPDCSNCEEICCTGPNATVSLRLQDIAALIDQGLDKFITHERPKPWLLKCLPTDAQLEFESSAFATIFPILQHDKTNTCKLLTKENLCAAYPNWPLSCARYPYALDAQNKVIFYAKGCEFFETKQASEVCGQTSLLVTSCIESYNARIRDLILLYFAQTELEKIGLSKYLRLENLVRF